jgi:hypothetical protein
MDEKTPYVPLGKLLNEYKSAKGKIANEAASHGHDGFFPIPVVVSGANGSTTVRGQTKKATPLGDRGRLLVFIPTGERVTVMKEKVGQTYNGDDIHEVVSKDGRKFLASLKQLKELNK